MVEEDVSSCVIEALVHFTKTYVCEKLLVHAEKFQLLIKGTKFLEFNFALKQISIPKLPKQN